MIDFFIESVVLFGQSAHHLYQSFFSKIDTQDETQQIDTSEQPMTSVPQSSLSIEPLLSFETRQDWKIICIGQTQKERFIQAKEIACVQHLSSEDPLDWKLDYQFNSPWAYHAFSQAENSLSFVALHHYTLSSSVSQWSFYLGYTWSAQTTTFVHKSLGIYLKVQGEDLATECTALKVSFSLHSWFYTPLALDLLDDHEVIAALQKRPDFCWDGQALVFSLLAENAFWSRAELLQLIGRKF